jgi:protein gp37
MSDTTKIQWADATFNPWIGCTKVSAGCKNCYAENTTRARVLRSQGQETWGRGAKRSRTSAAMWRKPIQWNEQPLIWDSEQHRNMRVFPSLCDWLDMDVDVEWQADFLKLVYDTPRLDWLLLTKRPENWHTIICAAWGILYQRGDLDAALWLDNWAGVNGQRKEYFPRNIWIGTSVENQEMADKRIPELLKIPARVRFLSVEPMLDAIQFDPHWLGAGERSGDNYQQPQIHLVIFGGESGPAARPCNVDWIRDCVKQCKAAGVPVFVKQLGAKPYDGHNRKCVSVKPFVMGDWQLRLKDPKGGDMAEWPEDLRVREFPV